MVSMVQMMANSTEASWCITFRHHHAGVDRNAWLMFDKEPIKASISFFVCDALRLFQPTATTVDLGESCTLLSFG